MPRRSFLILIALLSALSSLYCNPHVHLYDTIYLYDKDGYVTHLCKINYDKEKTRECHMVPKTPTSNPEPCQSSVVKGVGGADDKLCVTCPDQKPQCVTISKSSTTTLSCKNRLSVDPSTGIRSLCIICPEQEESCFDLPSHEPSRPVYTFRQLLPLTYNPKDKVYSASTKCGFLLRMPNYIRGNPLFIEASPLLEDGYGDLSELGIGFNAHFHIWQQNIEMRLSHSIFSQLPFKILFNPAILHNYAYGSGTGCTRVSFSFPRSSPFPENGKKPVVSLVFSTTPKDNYPPSLMNQYVASSYLSVNAALPGTTPHTLLSTPLSSTVLTSSSYLNGKVPNHIKVVLSGHSESGTNAAYYTANLEITNTITGIKTVITTSLHAKQTSYLFSIKNLMTAYKYTDRAAFIADHSIYITIEPPASVKSYPLSFSTDLSFEE